jgi:hypothetical protein
MSLKRRLAALEQKSPSTGTAIALSDADRATIRNAANARLAAMGYPPLPEPEEVRDAEP